jgi:hypothetical protein
MDHSSLLSALTITLESAPQAEDVDPIRMLLQAAREPSRADQRLVRLLEQLRQTPELEEFHDGMQVVAHTAHAVSYPYLTDGFSLLQTIDMHRTIQTNSANFRACRCQTTLPCWSTCHPSPKRSAA